VRRCDQIAVMEGGRLVEQGGHDQLLMANGQYATMCRYQHSDIPPPSSPNGVNGHAPSTPGWQSSARAEPSLMQF